MGIFRYFRCDHLICLIITMFALTFNERKKKCKLYCWQSKKNYTSRNVFTKKLKITKRFALNLIFCLCVLLTRYKSLHEILRLVCTLHRQADFARISHTSGVHHFIYFFYFFLLIMRTCGKVAATVWLWFLLFITRTHTSIVLL